ncbi:uncharacterized protein LOC129287583 isoform X1 [Prosopis cineraria]|uniref:uncharacterized protein LOC129287583 isoform X1 n=1 Tax=Prosopis cineraria TaxID=364024 RepID=UPI0024100541|nr:uncharacterized protein LOC129287583 isoform X1 [Prosopis cineraria]
MDVVTDDLKDFKTFQIQLMLMKSGIKFKEKSQMVRPPQPPPSKTTPEKGWRKILGMIMEQNNSNWLEEMRGNLSLVATMISTISFQAMINPPGGFVQQGILSDNEDPFGCLSENGYRTCPGDSVSAITFEDYLHPYMKYNTVCFIGSLSVALLLVSGVPLKHKAVIWMLSIGMCITLTFLSLTYLQGLYVVTPSGKLFDSARRMFHVSLMCWIGFLGVVAVFITLRFLYWLVKNEKKTSDINSSKDNGIRKYMKSNVCLNLFF